jgi:thiol-disulfide isomerase/thioredoxin
MSRWHGLFTAALACAALAASAQELQPGKDYGVVTPPQKTDDPSKIVVIEFFSYGCPHCNAFNPSLTLWENRLPKDVHFEREAVIFGRQPWQKLAQIYYALQVIGKAEQLSPSVYGALHVERVDWRARRQPLRVRRGVQLVQHAHLRRSRRSARDGVPGAGRPDDRSRRQVHGADQRQRRIHGAACGRRPPNREGARRAEAAVIKREPSGSSGSGGGRSARVEYVSQRRVMMPVDQLLSFRGKP